MKLRERLNIYTNHGGSWYHLKLEFQKAGMSLELSNFFVSKISKKLGKEHSEICLWLYDFWVEKKDEEVTKSLISLRL